MRTYKVWRTDNKKGIVRAESHEDAVKASIPANCEFVETTSPNANLMVKGKRVTKYYAVRQKPVQNEFTQSEVYWCGIKLGSKDVEKLNALGIHNVPDLKRYIFDQELYLDNVALEQAGWRPEHIVKDLNFAKKLLTNLGKISQTE